ncbi:MAG: TolC family protein [Bacteroidales bacterium]|nr:TolC family protein [Bacteroidales bacterium]
MRGFILTLLLAASLPLCASEPLSLERCIAIALKEDRSLRQGEITLAENRSKAALSIMDWIPEINVGAGNDFNWGRSVDMQELLIVDNHMTLTASFSASASFSLTKGFLNGMQREALFLDGKSAELTNSQAETEVAARVTGAFFQILLCSQACEICRRNSAEIDSKLESASAEAEAGSRAMADLYELEAQAYRERFALQEARNKLRIAEMTLCDYLNLPPEEGITLLPPTGDSLPAPPDAGIILADDFPKAPSVELALNRLERDRIQVRIAKAAFLPDLTVAGGCGTYYSSTGGGGFMEQVKGNVNPSAGITLSIPIIDGSANTRNLAGARAQLARQEIEVEKVRQEAASALREAIAEAANLYGNCKAAEAGFKAASAVERIAQERFGSGEISGADYLAARNARLRAEAQTLQARYRYLLQLKLLECRYGIMTY